MKSIAPHKPPKKPLVEANLPSGAAVDPDALFEALIDIFGPELEEVLRGQQKR